MGRSEFRKTIKKIGKIDLNQNMQEVMAISIEMGMEMGMEMDSDSENELMKILNRYAIQVNRFLNNEISFKELESSISSEDKEIILYIIKTVIKRFES